jgi:hypothetical protein
MTIEDIDEKIKVKKLEHLIIYKKYSELSDSLRTISTEIDNLKTQKSLLSLELFQKSDNYLDKIKLFLKSDNGVYNESIEFLNNMGFYCSGYNSETNERCLLLMLYKDRSTNQQTINSIKIIMPIMENKFFPIFENTLSANGVYTLLIKENEFELELCRYHRKSILKTFKTVEEFVEYISQNHYYDESKNND